MKTLIGLSVAFLALMPVAGCGSEPVDETEVVVSLTDSVIIPGYQEAAADSSELRQAIDALCAQPSDSTLDNARQAWRDARASLKRTEATWTGPVHDRRSVSLLDWPETEPERIESMLQNSPATSEDDIRHVLASTQRGLGAVEYLLFQDRSLQQLAGQPTVRCEFLSALGQLAESETEAIVTSWTQGVDGGRAYRGFFTSESKVSLLKGQAVAELVRTQVFLIRTIVDMRLAAALGLRESGMHLTAIPGGGGENALADLRNEILGMRNVYVGAGGKEDLGISDIVSDLSGDTDALMRQQFEAALTAIDGVELPLRTAVIEEPAQVTAVYDRLVELQRTISTEVVSLLGVSVGFSDTDGDSMR